MGFCMKETIQLLGILHLWKPPISLVIFQFNGEMTWPCCRVCKHPQEATARWSSCIQWRTCQVVRRKPVDGESHHLVGNKPWMDTDGMISWLYINYISYIMLYIYIYQLKPCRMSQTMVKCNSQLQMRSLKVARLRHKHADHLFAMYWHVKFCNTHNYVSIINHYIYSIYWLVVWNMFYFSIYWACHHPNCYSVHHFSEG